MCIIFGCLEGVVGLGFRLKVLQGVFSQFGGRGVLKVKEEVFKSSRVLSIRVLSLADDLIWDLANILRSE